MRTLTTTEKLHCRTSFAEQLIAVHLLVEYLSMADLPLPIQIRLIKKTKTFSQFFVAYLKFRLNFEQFEKKEKKSLIVQVFLKLLTPKNLPTWMHKRSWFWKPFGSERVKGWPHYLTSKSKGRFLVNNTLVFGSAWCLVTAQIQFSLIKKIKIGRLEHSITQWGVRALHGLFIETKSFSTDVLVWTVYRI